MSAQPKKKISHVRGKTRRAHNARKLTQLPLCANCRHPKPGHIICPECGFYGKKKILTTKTDKRIAKQLHATKKAEVKKSKTEKAKATAKKVQVKAEAKAKSTRTTDEVKSSKVKNK